ncbi:MAG: hypothetical protein QOH81_297 [Sphingomonadales bacterium]|jgi:hypothetical protein|nr:hypothetical protein [Sphingomonadales bacterium]
MAGEAAIERFSLDGDTETVVQQPMTADTVVRRSERLAELEQLHLLYILLHVQMKDPDRRPFRTFADSWYAYHQAQKGAKLVDDNLLPLWMNKGDLEDLPLRCVELDAISQRAQAVYDRVAPYEPLVRDHSIPLRRVRDELFRAQPRTASDVKNVMLRWYCCCLLTQEEHGRLKGRLRWDMPSEWPPEPLALDPMHRFARYRATTKPIEIQLIDF